MGGAKPWETSNHALTQLSHAPVFCDHAPSPPKPAGFGHAFPDHAPRAGTTPPADQAPPHVLWPRPLLTTLIR